MRAKLNSINSQSYKFLVVQDYVGFSKDYFKIIVTLIAMKECVDLCERITGPVNNSGLNFRRLVYGL